MKKILLIIFLIPLLTASQNAKHFNIEAEKIYIHEQAIEDLVLKYKAILNNTGGIEGWRLQIKFTSKREDILPYQMKFAKLHPEIPSKIIFDSPYYKLTAGNFRTKNEALKIKNEITKNFPGSHPIAAIIEPNLLK